MKSRSPIGMFVFDGNGDVKIQLFGKVPGEAVKNFLQAEKGNEAGARETFRKEALKHFSPEELNEFLSGFCTELSKKSMAGAIGRDKFVIQASNALEEANKISNTLLMRTSEWFSLHYPEARISSEKLAESIAEYGNRKNWTEFRKSIGVDMNAEDEAAVKGFASLALAAFNQKFALEKYVKNSIREIAPNFSSLLEPLLAARILAAAGSMEKLAKMSASSIQLIGAEKALFRHLRKKGRAPKYGMIYTSALVQGVPEDRRGKAARIFAAKLMLAARIDYFSGRNEAEKLRKELKEEIEKIAQ